MFKPLIFFLGLRYTRPKQNNRFISFSTLASVCGITIGVATLITVLSVMNGFDHQIRHQLFQFTPHIRLTSADGPLKKDQNLDDMLSLQPHIAAVAPYIEGQGLLKYRRQTHPALVQGIEAEAQQHVSQLPHQMLQGHFDTLKPGQFHIIIGQALALQLGAQFGSRLQLLTPHVTVSPLGMWPQIKSFTITGIFDTQAQTGGVALDQNMAYINIDDARALFHLPQQTISGMRLTVDDLYIAPSVADTLQTKLPWPLQAMDWTREYEAFFKAIAMEKTMMFLILMLIIAVAAFNLLSTMVMTVQEKRADIAILRTMGAKQSTILLTFMVQGSLIGALGTLIGTTLGVLLATHVTGLAASLQHWLHTQLISPAVYFIDYLPSELQWHDVSIIATSSLCISIIATLYPSWRAAQIDPVEVLQYEG